MFHSLGSTGHTSVCWLLRALASNNPWEWFNRNSYCKLCFLICFSHLNWKKLIIMVVCNAVPSQLNWGMDCLDSFLIAAAVYSSGDTSILTLLINVLSSSNTSTCINSSILTVVSSLGKLLGLVTQCLCSLGPCVSHFFSLFFSSICYRLTWCLFLKHAGELHVIILRRCLFLRLTWCVFLQYILRTHKIPIRWL